MPTRLTRPVVILALLAWLPAAVGAQEAEFVRTLTLDPGGRVALRHISGDVTVTGVDGRELTVRATKRVGRSGSGADLDRVEVEIAQRGNRVEVETRYLGTDGDAVSVDYEIRVPRDLQVSIEVVAGDVRVEQVDRQVEIEVVSGTVTATGIAQLRDVEVVSGDVTLTDVGSEDALSVQVISGQLVLDGVQAPRVEASSVEGDITLRRIEADRVEVETVSGAITFDGDLRPTGRYELQSHSGRIRLLVPDGAGFEFEAESFSGALDSALAIAVAGGGTATSFDLRTGDFEGTVGGGGARVEAMTFSGDIQIETR